MAGPNIEPHPYDLAKMHNFYRCTNDVIRPLYYLQQLQIWKNLLRVSIPGAPVFFDLHYYSNIHILSMCPDVCVCLTSLNECLIIYLNCLEDNKPHGHCSIVVPIHKCVEVARGHPQRISNFLGYFLTNLPNHIRFSPNRMTVLAY